MIKFARAWDRPATMPVSAGEKLYEWTWINDEGVEVTEKLDVYAKIQSYEGTTHYKEYIDTYGNIDTTAIGSSSGAYADITPFGSDISDNNRYIASLVEAIRASIAAEQAKAVKQANDKSAEIATEVDKTGGKE